MGRQSQFPDRGPATWIRRIHDDVRVPRIQPDGFGRRIRYELAEATYKQGADAFSGKAQDTPAIFNEPAGAVNANYEEKK